MLDKIDGSLPVPIKHLFRQILAYLCRFRRSVIERIGVGRQVINAGCDEIVNRIISALAPEIHLFKQATSFSPLE